MPLFRHMGRLEVEKLSPWERMGEDADTVVVMVPRSLSHHRLPMELLRELFMIFLRCAIRFPNEKIA